MLANFEALFLEPSIKSKPLTISEKPDFEKKKFRIFVHCEVYMPHMYDNAHYFWPREYFQNGCTLSTT